MYLLDVGVGCTCFMWSSAGDVPVYPRFLQVRISVFFVKVPLQLPTICGPHSFNPKVWKLGLVVKVLCAETLQA